MRASVLEVGVDDGSAHTHMCILVCMCGMCWCFPRYDPYVRMNAWERHQQMMHDFMKYYGGSAASFPVPGASQGKSDLDVIREQHRCVREMRV